MLGTDKVIKTIASFPGCYAYNYMNIPTYTANAAAFKADPVCPLMDYPSKDEAVTTTMSILTHLAPNATRPASASQLPC